MEVYQLDMISDSDITMSLDEEDHCPLDPCKDIILVMPLFSLPINIHIKITLNGIRMSHIIGLYPC